MSEIAIRVRGLAKGYTLGAKQESFQSFGQALREMAAAPFRRFGRNGPAAGQEFWALRDVNFDIAEGEVVGVVGRNGAGKSTLLKILSRITEPTRGVVEVRGRVGSLLEVGTGFHPELTGRENIFLNGAILGMRRAEIAGKFDEIVAFAEVEKFLDTPVKHYSSGMYLRLAFAVAAHLEPNILLVDEVLAVGDAAFQKKCTGKMSDVARQGRTVMFVSHNMAAVRQLCSSAFLLSEGTVVESGSPEEIIRQYLQLTFADTNNDLTTISAREGAGDIRFSSIRFEDETGMQVPGLVSGQFGRIVLGVRSLRSFSDVRVCIGLLDSLNQRLFCLDSGFVACRSLELEANGELACEIPRVHLAPGRYRVELWIQADSEEQDRLYEAATVDVQDGNFFKTGRAVADGFQVALMDYRWRVNETWDLAATGSGSPAQRNTAS